MAYFWKGAAIPEGEEFIALGDKNGECEMDGWFAWHAEGCSVIM